MAEPLRPGFERFPRRFASLDELPPAVRDAILRVEDPAGIVLLMILPPQEYAVQRKNWLRYLPFGWRVTPPRWLAFGPCQITLVEAAPDGGVRTAVIPFADLLEIRLVSVLLYAYLELAWRGAGRVERRRLEFNFVGERLVRRGIDHMRDVLRVAWRHGAAPDAPVALANIMPLKFRNYLRAALLPGEPILDAAYQPAIRQGERRPRRYLSPNRAIARTDHALILVEEDHPGSRRDYMMVQCYYPLAHLSAAALDVGQDARWLRLWFGAQTCGQEVRLPLEADTSAVLDDALRPWLAARAPVRALLPELP